MDRRFFVLGSVVGGIGLIALPKWIMAEFGSKCDLEMFEVNGPREHVRHGSVHGFSGPDLSMSKFGVERFDRNVFYKNGYSKGCEDPMFIQIEFGDRPNCSAALLHIESGQLFHSGSEFPIERDEVELEDGSKLERVFTGNMKVEPGDIIFVLKGEARINGYRATDRHALHVNSAGHVHCDINEAILIRSRVNNIAGP